MSQRLKLPSVLLVLLGLAWLLIKDQEALVLMIVILSVSGVYILGLVRIWRNAGLGHGISIWRALCFLVGMLILLFTLSGPMDALADRAFSMHMVQHMLLIKVIAPLLLLGEFSPAFLWAVGRNTAHRTATIWTQTSWLGSSWKQLTNAYVAWTLYALCLWVWHIPTFYQAALKSEPVHDLEHFLFLTTSLLFWWYVIKNGRNPKVRYGTAVLYLFTTLLHESALGALLTFSSRNWYVFYTSSNPWGLSPLSDQQLAGIIMWLPGGVLFMSLIVFYFGTWLQTIEKSMPIHQAELAQTGEQNE